MTNSSPPGFHPNDVFDRQLTHVAQPSQRFAETLNIEEAPALLAYLRHRSLIGSTETPHVEHLAGGVSSRTVLVRRPSGEGWVIKQSLARLRVAADWFSDPQRIHNEGAALRWLQQLAPAGAVPVLVFEDHVEHILAMQAVPAPHTNWKERLLAGDMAEAPFTAFGQLLAMIHTRSAARLEEIRPDFADNRWVESLRIEPFYRYTAQRWPEASGFYSQLIAAMQSHALVLAHGDYSPKNVLLYQDQLVLLDHEVAHIGDPAFDVGFALAHLLSKANHRVTDRAQFGRLIGRFWAAYADALGEVTWRPELESRAVRHALGCLLARVDGRSPLEYLEPEEQERQRRAVLALLTKLPDSIAALTAGFFEKLS